jgi:hypothetical protein
MTWNRKQRTKKQYNTTSPIQRTGLARALSKILKVSLSTQQEKALRTLLDEAVGRGDLMPSSAGPNLFTPDDLLSFACGHHWKRTLSVLNTECTQYVGAHGTKVILRKGGTAKPDKRPRRTPRKTPRHDSLHVPEMAASVGVANVITNSTARPTASTQPLKTRKASWLDALLSQK